MTIQITFRAIGLHPISVSFSTLGSIVIKFTIFLSLKLSEILSAFTRKSLQQYKKLRSQLLLNDPG